MCFKRMSQLLIWKQAETSTISQASSLKFLFYQVLDAMLK